MSAMEALMWTLEADPRLSSTFANLTVFDRAPDMAEVARRMGSAAVAVPRLAQRVVSPSLPLGSPRWEFDAGFDPRNHLRSVSIGRKRSRAALLATAVELYSTPLDPSRPLWEFVLISGLPSGKSAMLQRFHHAITDGVGGIRMSEQFLDLERAPATRPAPRPPRSTPAPAPAPANSASATGHSPLESVVDAMRWPIGAARAAVERLGSLPHTRDELVAMGTEWVNAGRSLADGTMLVTGGRSPLWRQRGLGRAFLTYRLDLAEVKRAASALGGSVNDFFVSGIADAAGRYHRREGENVEHLRMSMPVSVRQDRSQAGNAFRPTQHDVPTGNMGPRQRFAAVHEMLSAARHERHELSLGPLAGAAGAVPPAALTWIGLRLTNSVDFATSNVRAAPFPVFMAGARMLENYPLGPVANTAFNLTTMSYDGSLFLGLVVDNDAVESPDRLLADLVDSYRDLFSAAPTT